MIPNPHANQFQQIRFAIEQSDFNSAAQNAQQLVWLLGGTQPIYSMPPEALPLYILSLMFSYQG